LFSGSGANLTNLNATNIIAGNIIYALNGINTTDITATGTITGITADGIERDGSIPINNFTIRRNGLQFFLTYNDAGTIRNVSLGTVA
jgi:hypothetical protein